MQRRLSNSLSHSDESSSAQEMSRALPPGLVLGSLRNSSSRHNWSLRPLIVWLSMFGCSQRKEGFFTLSVRMDPAYKYHLKDVASTCCGLSEASYHRKLGACDGIVSLVYLTDSQHGWSAVLELGRRWVAGFGDDPQRTSTCMRCYMYPLPSPSPFAAS